MSKRVAGIFNGTAATVYVCIGFVPDWVRIVSHQATNPEEAFWSVHMRGLEIIEGSFTAGSSGIVTDFGAGAGISPYIGKELMTSTNQTSVTYAEGVYLKWDDTDYRYGPNLGPGGASGDAVSDTIDTWTLGNSSNRTGNFNEDLTGTETGVGSRVCIDGIWYTITVLTAGQGEAANEVTFNLAPASGEVQFISGRFTHKPIPLGEVTPAGFRVSYTTTINVNDEIQFFEAGTYDK